MNSLTPTERSTRIWQFALVYLVALALPLLASYFLFSAGSAPVGPSPAVLNTLKAKLDATQQQLDTAQARLAKALAPAPAPALAVPPVKLNKVELISVSPQEAPAYLQKKLATIKEGLQKSGLLEVSELSTNSKAKSDKVMQRLRDNPAVTICYFGEKDAGNAYIMRHLLTAYDFGTSDIKLEDREKNIGRTIPGCLEIWLK